MRRKDGDHSDIAEVKRFERAKWDDYYAQALRGQGQEHQRNLWWRVSDDDTIRIIQHLFTTGREIRILEAACGSGDTTFLLADYLQVRDITLVDLSRNALRFARSLVSERLVNRVHYVEADLFTLPFADASFDLVWNVGTIEHYPVKGIRSLIREMLRVTVPGGWLVLAIPNRWSIAVLKAWALGNSFGRSLLRWVPGYRYDSEILYGNNEIKRIVKEEVGLVNVAFAGNCLWTTAPDRLIRLAQHFLPQSPASFLTFFVAQRRTH